MKDGDTQKGSPGILYTDTAANIAAIAAPVEAQEAYASDTHVLGVFNGTTWDWLSNTAHNHDHGALTGLADDDHTGYVLLAGRAGGQVVYGGNAANDDLTLEGTSHGTKATSYVILQPTSGNVGIGTVTPAQKLDVVGNINLNTNGTSVLFSSYKGANSDGYNLWIGGGGQSAVGAVGTTFLGSYNVAIGMLALQSNTTGYYNTAIGMLALYYNTSGKHNFALGANALLTNTTGEYNIAIGSSALLVNTTGVNNSAIGFSALLDNTTGEYNLAIGSSALEANTEGDFNVAIGYLALYVNTTGNNNVAAGVIALYSNTTGYNNVAAGFGAGRTIIDGNSNTFIGYEAGYHASQLSSAVNSMALGNGAYTTASNQVVIGNASVTQTLLRGNVLIGTATDGMTAGGSLAIAQDLAHRGTLAGFFNKAPAAQHAHIADATDAATVITVANHILSVLEEYGLLAAS
jgi:hypothetical protein